MLWNRDQKTVYLLYEYFKSFSNWFKDRITLISEVKRRMVEMTSSYFSN